MRSGRDGWKEGVMDGDVVVDEREGGVDEGEGVESEGGEGCVEWWKEG